MWIQPIFVGSKSLCLIRLSAFNYLPAAVYGVPKVAYRTMSQLHASLELLRRSWLAIEFLFIADTSGSREFGVFMTNSVFPFTILLFWLL
jgi:hypothetical protein